MLNTPSCSRVLVFDSTNNTSNKNEVLLEYSETTHVFESPTPEQLDLQCEFLDSDEANSITLEKSFEIGPRSLK